MKALWKTVIGSHCLLLGMSALSAANLSSDTVGDGAVLTRLKTVSLVASTVPANGDVNPYGMAQVKHTVGKLSSGHILVSNFNNAGNLQGTGTTIVDVAPDGTTSLFALLDAKALPGECPGGIGLTTALVVLNEGWVVVGSLPTTDGTSDTARAGCLIVLDSSGKPVETLFGSLINGPWDMTAFESGHEAKLFVTNVLNGTVAAKGQIVKGGTVVRLDLQLSPSQPPSLESITVIGSGFSERTDPAALVIGPTGVALSLNCGARDAENCDPAHEGDADRSVLYVADTVNSRIAVIERPLKRSTSAGAGETVSAGGTLNAPLGLVTTPNGDLLTVNGGDGFITEITPGGRQVAKFLLDNTGGPPPGGGTLFGLVFDPNHGVYFVDDGTNTVNLLH
jgi:hypothetical protein